MYTPDDLIDALFEVLAGPARGGGPGGGAAGAAVTGPAQGPRRGGRPGLEDGLPAGRRFLSDYEVRKALTPGAQQLTIPRDAIVSPLAMDWLALKGIRIVRE